MLVAFLAHEQCGLHSDAKICDSIDSVVHKQEKISAHSKLRSALDIGADALGEVLKKKTSWNPRANVCFGLHKACVMVIEIF